MSLAILGLYNFLFYIQVKVFKGKLAIFEKLFQIYVSRFSIKGDLALEIVIYMTRDHFVNLTLNLLNDHLTELLHISILGMQPF
jgi:hypothetical protein